MEGLATWWPLEFDNISLRVCDIDRGSFAFGAVTGASQSGFHTTSRQQRILGPSKGNYILDVEFAKV